jgi:hypothetical protein
MFNQLYRFYNSNILLQDIDKNYKLSKLVYNQKISKNGKTRAINVKYKGNKITIFTEPIPPMFVKNSDKPISQFMKRCKKSAAVQFIKDVFGDVKIDNVINNKKIEGVKFYTKDISMIIPVKYKGSKSGSGVSEYFAPNEDSLKENFDNLQRLARYITEYFVYYYSLFCKNNGATIDNIQDINIIADFIDENVTIIEDFKYGYIGKEIDIGSPSLFSGNKLVLKSEKTLQRLSYYLMREIRRNKEKVVNFYTHRFIEDYFLNLQDFKEFDSQIIVYGKDSIDKIVLNRKYNDNNILDCLMNVDYPYYFNNIKIDNNIYLTQQVFNPTQFLGNAIQWKETRTNILEDNTQNIGQRMIDDNNAQYILCGVNNMDCDVIKLFRFNAENENIVEPNKLLGFVKEDDNIFRSMLFL